MSERRKHPRLEREYPVDIRLFDVPLTATAYKLPLVRCRATDISESGLRLETPVEMPVGHRVHLRVMIDDPPCSYLHTALVRWVRPSENEAFTTGVEFISASQVHHQDWSELVHQVMRETGAAQIQAGIRTGLN